MISAFVASILWPSTVVRFVCYDLDQPWIPGSLHVLQTDINLSYFLKKG